MAKLKEVSVGEALDKGYHIVGPTYPEKPQEPSALDWTAIVGLEVVPTMVGWMLGGWAGGGAGGFVGNWASQEYRIWRGIQSEVSGGELAAATAVSAL